MQHFQKFAQFRYHQFSRFLAEIGVFRVLILVVVGAIGVKLIANQKEISPIILLVVNAVLLFQHHLNRKDISFLKLTKPKHYLLFILAEYGGFSILVLLISLFIWPSIYVVGHLILPIIALLPPLKVKTQKSKSNVRFLWAEIESRKYLQHHWMAILLVQVLCCFFYAEIAIQIIGIVLLIGLYLGKFKAFEGKEIILSHLLTPKAFLRKKTIENTVVLMATIALPISLLAVSCHLPQIALAVLAIVAVLSIEINYLKYQFYCPGEELDDTVFSVQIGLVLVSSLLPFLLPFALFLVLRARNKALQNLKIYAGNY